MTTAPTRRLYVALTLAGLAEAAASGIVAGHWPRVLSPDDTEEGEYAAMMTAADASAQLVADADDGQRRRVVVVLDKIDSDAEVDHPIDALVAIHVDATDDADPDDDLAWYAAQELPELV